MIRFDYLRSARPALVRRFSDLHVPPDLKGPLFAIAAAVTIVTTEWFIESYRLSVTLAFEGSYRTQYDESRLQLAKTKVLYVGLERVAGLAKEVHEIQASGDEEAMQFAEIGNRLPPHVWLTSISNDGTGISLSGKAIGLAALSRTFSGLAHTRHGYATTLVSANGDEHAAQAGILHYELRLDGAAQ
ncbi:MAG: PilN domain-containing protein [Candidatus Eremiobacteraeota bacterium]|nr:PilN domain-containing protein [Candidatus Eremiobacteraeota bacterium]